MEAALIIGFVIGAVIVTAIGSQIIENKNKQIRTLTAKLRTYEITDDLYYRGKGDRCD